jgi:hypothetical protein
MFEVFEIPGAPDRRVLILNYFIILKTKGVTILFGKKVKFENGMFFTVDIEILC